MSKRMITALEAHAIAKKQSSINVVFNRIKEAVQEKKFTTVSFGVSPKDQNRLRELGYKVTREHKSLFRISWEPRR